MKAYYKNGLPFSEALKKSITGQLKRVENKKASLLIIDGLQGEGKTTLGVEVIDEINREYGQDRVSLKLTEHPQIGMGGKQFIKYLRLCETKKLKALMYDEAGDFNKRGALTSFNNMLNRVFQRFRGFRIIVVVCLPNFCILDNWLFDQGIPRVLIHCYNRGPNTGNFSAYSLYRMNWIRYHYSKLPLGAKHLAYSRVIPNFRGHFQDLPPARSKALDNLSTKSKRQSLELEEIMAEGLVPYTVIASKLNRSVIWVKITIAKLKIKPKSKIHRVNYFDNTIIDVLSNYLDTNVRRRKE